MKDWNKKTVTKQEIEPLCKKYGIDQILAAILIRRGITEGSELLFYLEDSLRFQHEPYSFLDMEDAVERILQAKEEGEKVLIFGDKDVDGVTSTTILYEQLVRMGIDVQWRIPVGEDAYGLSIAAVDDFAAQDGTLIVTVDCGISCTEEIAHANSLGIDVIITDHHNPPEVLPEAVVILDPKLKDSGYPYPEISGAAIAYKLASALRFAESNLYNAEICIIEISEPDESGTVVIDGIRVKNLTREKTLHEALLPGQKSIYDTRLLGFLQGQVIYAWDAQKTRKQLENLFGSGVEFNLHDLRSEIAGVLPQIKGKSSRELAALSHFAKYEDKPLTSIDGILNLYITYGRKTSSAKHQKIEDMELQLVALAAIADIMPLKNENRIFIRAGIASMKRDGLKPGLAELFARLKINKASVTSTSLSWYVTPVLNAAGRLGQADVAVRLLTSTNGKERTKLAEKIFELNEQRKRFMSEASARVKSAAEQSLEENGHKLCVVIDQELNRGITGNFAGRLVQEFGVPAIAVTYNDKICTGSMRSCRNFISTKYLESFGESFFINYGGHNYAAGFSFEREKLDEFRQKIRELNKTVILSDEDDDIEIDAEIPPEHLRPELFDILNKLEPFGNENPQLRLMSRSIRICDAMVMGKREPYTLKLVFDCGCYKFPALMWNQAERLKQDISVGQNYDILYNISWNHYNGNVTPQLEIIEIRKSN